MVRRQEAEKLPKSVSTTIGCIIVYTGMVDMVVDRLKYHTCRRVL